MLYLILLLCTGAVLGTSVRVNVSSIEKLFYAENYFEVHFEQFILDHDKHYDTEEEKLMRYEVFRNNVHKINDLNMMHDTIYGIIKFSDMTHEEFSKSYASCNLPLGDAIPCSPVSINLNSINFEDTVDWRERNAVTPVKNQGGCGACWAFSLVGSLESQHAIKTGQLTDFSVQQLVDCDDTDHGCDGGWAPNAGLYALQNGIMLEADYPYQFSRGTCQYDANKVAARFTNCYQFPVGTSEEELKAALAQYGPISITIDATPLHSYNGGIVRNCISGGCDHVVLLVGFSDEGGEPHWIVKNSWGSDWGEQGYFKLPYGSQACMITQCEMTVLQM